MVYGPDKIKETNIYSPHDEHRSSGPRPVKLCSVLRPKTSQTLFCPPAQDQSNFVRTSQFFSFYLELYKNKFKKLIQTSKLKILFRGLIFHSIKYLSSQEQAWHRSHSCKAPNFKWGTVCRNLFSQLSKLL